MSSTTILLAKPSFSLRRSPNPLIRFNWQSLKTSHSCLRLAPRMRLAGISFCEAPYNAATHLVVQDDLEALLQVHLCSKMGFFLFFIFLLLFLCVFANSSFAISILMALISSLFFLLHVCFIFFHIPILIDIEKMLDSLFVFIFLMTRVF
jgi:hypothetical protein